VPKRRTDKLTVREARPRPAVLLDSSFILALLDPRDPNHKGVRSVFGFMDPHNCRFYIPIYVFAEVISRIIQKGGKVSDALSTFENFLAELHGTAFMGTTPSVEEIVARYQDLARKQIRFLRSNDFFIATEGILSKSLVLTCDFGMYERVKKNYKDIYYVASSSKKYKNDIPEFTERLLTLSGK
jgi:predicted nucleic acid-binding protein